MANCDRTLDCLCPYKTEATQTNLPNFQRKQGSTGVSGEVQTTSFSIGYAALAFAIADSVPVALVENRRGQFVSPYSLDASENAADTLSLDPVTNAADITDADASGIYPMLGLTYLLLNVDNNTFTDCSRLRETLKVPFFFFYGHGLPL